MHAFRLSNPMTDNYMGQSAHGRPRVVFDLEGLRQNCNAIVGSCRNQGVSVAGVTKGATGNPDIAQIMLECGIEILADARVENLERLREAEVTAPLMLLRSPSLSGMQIAAGVADIFMMSDKASLRALALACQAIGKIAEVIIMIDLGDLREGIAPDELRDLVCFVETLEGVRIEGIGTNHSCHIGVMPDHKNMAALSDLAQQVEKQLGRTPKYVSAGNSSAFDLASAGTLPPNLNQLRLGEAILMGRETADGRPIKGTRQDNFVLIGQIIEIGQKTFDATRQRGLNALGLKPELSVLGERRLALVNLGAVDVALSGLTPLNTDLQILGGSSDHLIVDATNADGLGVGGEIAFSLNYHALSTAMSSPYLMQMPGSVSEYAVQSRSNDSATSGNLVNREHLNEV